MKTIHFKTWKNFKRRVDALFDQSSQPRIATKLHVSSPVFRGQANSQWPLSTTLERESGPEIDLVDFYRNVFHPSLTQLQRKLNFELPPPLSNNDIKKLTFGNLCKELPWSDKLALLRHHGSPSPLLDWSDSPYVAAYFAFAPIPSMAITRVAIFAYRESVGTGIASQQGKPRIKHIGHWMPVHGRHIRQQSTYTFCFQEIKSRIAFVSHAHADKNRPLARINHQDNEITKFTIPVSEREEALRDLRKMNVTEYSLFDTDDALVKTVVRRALENPK